MPRTTACPASCCTLTRRRLASAPVRSLASCRLWSVTKAESPARNCSMKSDWFEGAVSTNRHTNWRISSQRRCTRLTAHNPPCRPV